MAAVRVSAWLSLLGWIADGACGSEPVAPVPPPPPPPVAARPPPVGCASGVPAAACVAAGIRVCAAGDRDRIGEWRYALVAGPFETTQSVTAGELAAAWRAGKVAAAP